MFRCQLCAKQTLPGARAHRRVTQTRATDYPARERAHFVVEPDAPKKKRSRRKKADDPGGHGSEIVRELLVCADYAPASGNA